MPESLKATRAPIPIGSIQVDGFMLPDGSYRMSRTQTAECVGLGVQNASDFLRSKAIKTLLGEGYTPQKSERKEIEIEPEPGKRGASRFLPMSLDVVVAYWHWQSHRGNKKALALCMALATESLERRFDDAFGVTRTEQERDDLLSQRLQQLEQDLKGATDFEAAAQYELNYVRDWLKQKGLDPWELPGEEEIDSR